MTSPTSSPTPASSPAQAEPSCVDAAALMRWGRATESVEVVVLACHDASPAPGPHGTAVVRWPGCLDEQALGLVPQLLADGVRSLRLRWCPTHGPTPSSLPVWRQVLGELLETEPAAGRSLRHGPVLRAEAAPLPRRALVGARLDGVLDLALDEQARLIQSLRLLYAQDRIDDPSAALAELPAAGRVLTASDCTLCAACTWACPHGALEMADADSGLRGLVQDLAACRGCQACVGACPVDALHAGGTVSLAQAWQAEVTVLAADRPRTCRRCGARYSQEVGSLAAHDVTRPATASLAPAPGGQDEDSGLCPLCQVRERSPFLTELPPEAERALPPSVLAAIRRSRGLS
ncbi:4Fe-4S binding protein [Actinomyces urogenitalis]|nr:4Fe-4S binding protein [Actinomyces urogenitalis]KGF01533.1 hypothetical protein HMPREF1626_06580 [Actinomyces urogenitalis S6-C4]MBS5977644.1 4Fe-4S binding protein [Actinomyces urogenitalis]MBS6072721.1 4Fe-4S binding protein [Actinomyces urogenitalis]MDU0864346.1 4Fe-4S binding protein [Actinomyces urogenitalis]MDU0874954.1 4Fe-4S binding protein [Actinomyces urogenitalis]